MNGHHYAESILSTAGSPVNEPYGPLTARSAEVMALPRRRCLLHRIQSGAIGHSTTLNDATDGLELLTKYRAWWI